MSIVGSIRALPLLVLLAPSGGLAVRNLFGQEDQPQMERADQKPTGRLGAQVKGFRGEAGIYVRHRTSGRTVPFKTAAGSERYW